MRSITPATEADVSAITSSLQFLRKARTALRGAGARTAARAVDRALKSAEGAQRHARHRLQRT